MNPTPAKKNKKKSPRQLSRGPATVVPVVVPATRVEETDAFTRSTTGLLPGRFLCLDASWRGSYLQQQQQQQLCELLDTPYVEVLDTPY